MLWEERFESRYGFWRGFVDDAISRYLDCGLFEHGFARVRCGTCRHEFLVALDCWSYCISFALLVRIGRLVHVAVIVVDAIGPDAKATLAAPELDGVGADAKS